MLVQQTERNWLKMLEFICSIPEWLGWTFVGIACVACVIMMCLLIQTIVVMIRERKEDNGAWQKPLYLL